MEISEQLGKYATVVVITYRSRNNGTTALEIDIGSRQLPRGLFPSKIYIQFTIFNTYFST